MKICGQCQKAIRPGEKHTAYNIETASGVVPTVYRHDTKDCKPLPTQTAPAGRW